MANEQRTVRPQCTGVAVTAGGGKGGGRAGGGGLGLGLGWGGVGWGRQGTGKGAGPRLRPGGGGAAAGKEVGRGAGDKRPGGRLGVSGRGRACAAGAGLRGGLTAGECQGLAVSPLPARTYPRPGSTFSFSRHEFTWDFGNNCAVGAALQPCHLLGVGGGAQGSELILFLHKDWTRLCLSREEVATTDTSSSDVLCVRGSTSGPRQ